MITKTLLYWILLTFSWVSCDIQLNDPCKLHSIEGTCIPITSCKLAMTILSINDVQTLRSMFCGFEDRLPKVCCPIVNKYDNPTTVKNVATTIEYQYREDENEVVISNSPPPPKKLPSALPSRDVCGPVNGEDRIYGGQIAAIDEFPWIARLKFFNPTSRKEIYLCSGTLISDRFVITAAHCLTVYKLIGVRLGEWDTETNIDCQDGFCNDAPIDVKVEKTIIYPGFDKRNITSGDIALLRLEHPVKFTDFVRPICLPTTEYIARQDYIDSTYTAAGWGKTEFGQVSVLPRKVHLNYVPYSICSVAIPQLQATEDPNVICAGGKKGLDTCQGDSGGPLLRIVTENYKQNWYLYGITSQGVTNCGTAGKPAIYTRVSKYMDWIRETISGE